MLKDIWIDNKRIVKGYRGGYVFWGRIVGVVFGSVLLMVSVVKGF